MSITLTERTVGIWYVSMDGQDWMAHVAEEDETFELTYRHRYYVDDKNFDSEDKKNWYSGSISKPETTEDDIISVMDKMCKMMSDRQDGVPYRIIKGDKSLDEFVEEFTSMPFSHHKIISKEEAEEQGLINE